MKITLNTADALAMTTFVLPKNFNGTVEFACGEMPVAELPYKNGSKHGWFTLFGKQMWLYEEGKTKFAQEKAS